MKIETIITVEKENGKCTIYIDEYKEGDRKYAYTGNPITFTRRALFTQGKGKPAFELPLEDAKEMAREILKLGE
ncbi:unnamed protein product [marine sediment metagenome]|uniref:Uncharacterized protein n=1 Tax=marine sediment metagenome TaxID=412755 RepID=X1BZA4_9ZZZZ